ncbi:MBL fold metallo-hydrolase [Cohnella soli]|uniref:MBL fold metallo-hydrolase n=1 Tax=Cohnella soli TaxID=425005 RepID=A0ABW0I728_9BACL
MKVRFLGTAAFEGIPAMFCGCELCKKAFELGGKEIRTRTSVMLDDDLKIDFPPDTFTHMVRERLDLEAIRTLLFTHSHSDHLYAEDLVARLPGYTRTADSPLPVYGNELVVTMIKAKLDAEGGAQGRYSLNRVRPYSRIELHDGFAVPLPVVHDPMETCLLYYIEKNGKAMLYGHDSGTFPDETWDWLKDKKLDLAILECTMGHSPYRKSHMNIEAVLETNARLRDDGILKDGGSVVVTHFSHNAQLLHTDFQAIFEPHGIQVAYDGMQLEIE